MSRASKRTQLLTVDVELAPGPDTAPPRLRRYPGLDGVLAEMARLVDVWRAAPAVRALAVALATAGSTRRQRETGHADMRDAAGVAAAVYQAVVRRVIYVRDPVRAELVQAPLDTWRRGIGDCEDMTVLGGALLAAVGIPVRAVTVGYGETGYDHVYLEFDAGERGPDGEPVWHAWDATLATRVGATPSATPRRRKSRELTPAGGQFGLAGAPAPMTAPVRPAPPMVQRLGKPAPPMVQRVAVPPAPMVQQVVAQPAVTLSTLMRPAPRLASPLLPASGVFTAAGSARSADSSRKPGARPDRARRAAPPATQTTEDAAPTAPGAAEAAPSDSPRPGLNPLLLLGGAGAVALLFMMGSRGPKPAGKKKRTVVTTDEDFA